MNGLTLTRLLWARIHEEETQHLPRCVGSSRISIEASRAASQPCVSGSMFQCPKIPRPLTSVWIVRVTATWTWLLSAVSC
jgi:hypothetical protein